MTLIEIFITGLTWTAGIALFLILTFLMVALPPWMAIDSFWEGDFGNGLMLLGLTVVFWFLWLMALAVLHEELGIGPDWLGLPEHFQRRT